MSQQAAAPVGMAPGGSIASAMASSGMQGVPASMQSSMAGAGMEPGAGFEGYGSGGGLPAMNNMGPDEAKQLLQGAGMMSKIANLFGKDPEEREKNAKAFAALTKDVGNTVKDLSESTLLQRMMEHSMSGPQFLDTGQAPSGGVAAIPKTFDPAMAAQIMNRFGFK